MSKKILVIYKKSAYQLAVEQKNQKIIDLIQKNDDSVSTYMESHNAHLSSINRVKEILKSFNLDKIDFRYRAKADKVNDYDLVITVGGDGTFLWASKFVDNRTPIMGVNSAPGSSIGFFTCANENSFREHFSSWLEGSNNPKRPGEKQVVRLALKINGAIVQDRILNDVLFAAVHPAAMTRYIFSAPTFNGSYSSEEQKSSGIWISTACGSTGANLSAGGVPLTLEDDKGQYIVREPMKNFLGGVDYKLIHGFFKKGQTIEITCKTRRALLACDGTTITFPVTTGDRITVCQSKDQLNIWGKK